MSEARVRDPLRIGRALLNRARRVRGAVGPRIRARALGHRYLAHFGLHERANAGDTLLFVSTRMVFDQLLGPQRWKLEPLRRAVRATDIRRLNREASGAVVGGGGLLLPDTNRNERSGWQWNVDTSDLKDLAVPLVVFGIGYNRFRGQEDFHPNFAPSIRACVEQSCFFGLRNTGSIEALRDYLPDELSKRLSLQPCPTTMLSRLAPRRPAPNHPKDSVLALNCAFDRSSLRYGSRQADQLAEIVEAMWSAHRRGWDLVVTVHDRGDEEICSHLTARGVPFTIEMLRGTAATDVLGFYSGVGVSIGMRGHSQLIPFGLERPIISLVSHDKLRWFLDDVGRPDLAVDLAESDVAGRVGELLTAVEEDSDALVASLRAAQDRFWDITQSNVAEIGRDLHPDD